MSWGFDSLAAHAVKRQEVVTVTTREEVDAVNASGVLVGWSPYRGSAVCPACGSNELDVRQVVRVAQPGNWSLAGVQAKYPAQIGWQYRCTACGQTGSAEPKQSSGE